MANLITAPSYFQRRTSAYVPAMQYASDVNIQDTTRISFGAPAVASATAILNALDTTAAVTTQASGLLLSTMDAPYGRCLQIVSSGANTTVCTIDGWDYLGQPMSENLTHNGTNAVVGVKAFKWIRQIVLLANATTTSVGTHDKLGLPYKCIKCISEELAGAIVSTLGTLVTASLTDPATAITTDTRGTYDPQSTLNGSSTLTATFLFANDVNSSNNGGLHGLPHFAN